MKQLSYFLIATRQKLLGLPLKIGNRFGDREVPIREVVEYAKRLVNETLTELSRLPEAYDHALNGAEGTFILLLRPLIRSMRRRWQFIQKEKGKTCPIF